MKTQIPIKMALRYQAICVPIQRSAIETAAPVPDVVLSFVTKLQEVGFSVSEELLHALGLVSVDYLAQVAKVIEEVLQVNLNWAPLVKGWDVPTGETADDHMMVCLTNLFGNVSANMGTELPCGHVIPHGTFPLERYNGCPYCGTPFHTAGFVYKGQNTRLKTLRLFTMEDIEELFASLLTSTVPLNGTEKDTLEQLLLLFNLPKHMDVTIKETAMLVVRSLVRQHKDDEASCLLRTPSDVLRYLWFEKTGRLQVIEPRTLVAHSRRLYSHLFEPLDQSEDAAGRMKQRLKLHYDRTTCLRTAKWLNQIPLNAKQAAEEMHPKRNMWIRFIRALRLSEYSRKKGFEHLAEIMDIFYRKDYSTWKGKADQCWKTADKDALLKLLKERPGSFSRCLFAAMLRFGAKDVLQAFDEIADKLPTRLLLSLMNAAESYFDTYSMRLVRTITGTVKTIEPNRLLAQYSVEERKEMEEGVKSLYCRSILRRFGSRETDSRTIFIDPMLYHIPIKVGDRSTHIQDTSCALTGTRFLLDGDHLRLFMQWGKGLPAQPMDMDLSCHIAYPEGYTEYCYFGHLVCRGAKHSGDIRSIPDHIGTAEYIELSISELSDAGAVYVTFTCNAYSVGTLAPNLTVGWMNAAHPMKISEETGVAYDPSCVQHMVRISAENLDKGLVFGVLEVSKREITWLELPFSDQITQGADQSCIQAILHKLQKKLSVGDVLDLKAKAQNLRLVNQPELADEQYTYDWALNPASVSKVLFPS